MKYTGGRILSGSDKYPNRKDVFRSLLSAVVEEGSRTSWAHFEVLADKGWIWNMLFLKEPVVEVALLENGSLQLILPARRLNKKRIPPIPDKWDHEKNGLRKVPIFDVEELLDWIDACLAACSGKQDYRVTGWLEG